MKDDKFLIQETDIKNLKFLLITLEILNYLRKTDKEIIIKAYENEEEWFKENIANVILFCDENISDDIWTDFPLQFKNWYNIQANLILLKACLKEEK